MTCPVNLQHVRCVNLTPPTHLLAPGTNFKSLSVTFPILTPWKYMSMLIVDRSSDTMVGLFITMSTSIVRPHS